MHILSAVTSIIEPIFEKYNLFCCMFCCIVFVVCLFHATSHKLYLLVVFLEVVLFHTTSYIFFIQLDSCMKCCILLMSAYYTTFMVVFTASVHLLWLYETYMLYVCKLYVLLYVSYIQLRSCIVLLYVSC